MTDHLWPLCHECCIARGAKPPTWPVTCCQETYALCGETKWIAGYSDYLWPNGDIAIWD